MARKQISKKIRFEIFKRDSFTCQYCGSKAPDVVLEVDHIKPVSDGGDNDILNLITSCFDCNRGKGSKKISDKSIIHAQIDQLSELNERRLQIEMLLEWKKGLNSIKDDVVEKVCDYFTDLTGFSVSDSGKKKMSIVLRKYGLEMTIDSMDKSVSYYFKGDQETAQNSFNKVGAICNIESKSDDEKAILKIINSVKYKFSYSNFYILKKAYNSMFEQGIPIDDISTFHIDCTKWAELKNKMIFYGFYEDRYGRS